MSATGEVAPRAVRHALTSEEAAAFERLENTIEESETPTSGSEQ